MLKLLERPYASKVFGIRSRLFIYSTIAEQSVDRSFDAKSDIDQHQALAIRALIAIPAALNVRRTPKCCASVPIARPTDECEGTP